MVGTSARFGQRLFRGARGLFGGGEDQEPTSAPAPTPAQQALAPREVGGNTTNVYITTNDTEELLRRIQGFVDNGAIRLE